MAGDLSKLLAIAILLSWSVCPCAFLCIVYLAEYVSRTYTINMGVWRSW